MLNKIKKIKLSKSKYIYTVIAGLIIIAIGFTFAWWRWSSEINAIVNGQVCAPEIVFVGGSTINGHDLLPVRTKEEGLTKDIQVNLENLCDNDTAVLNLNLKPDILPEGLSDPSFKWALYEVTTEEVQGTPTETLTYVNDGNFNGKRQYVNDNDLISIATDLIVTQNISTYRLFVWIDGTMDNANTMGDNFFKFSIYGTGRDAIYKVDTIKNITMTSSTNYFLVDNEELLKDNIGSIEIKSFNNIPSTATEIDDNGVLSNDGTVKIFYEKNPETNLNKVYIGTSNGMLKMNTKMDYMFAGLTKVESLDLSRLDTSNVTSMVGVFKNSNSLTSINMNNWDTSIVTTMNGMFNGCSNLIKLDLSNFDTSNVTVMNGSWHGGMFYNCSSLEELDISSFDTSKITNMEGMFDSCSSLTTLDLSNFNTSIVTNMRSMFARCSSLVSLKVKSFDTKNVRDMWEMFNNDVKLKTLDLSSFDTRNVSDIRNMFAACGDLILLNISNFEFNNITNYGYFLLQVPSYAEIIVKDCSQYNSFTTKFGNSYTNLHTIDNDNCTA